MKWYKHISDSLDDPFIFDLIDQFGGDGYLVFFGTLEIMAREFDIKSPGTCTVSHRFLTKKLQLSKQKVMKVLGFCNKNNRILVEFEKDKLMLDCPKLKDLCDEWTKKQLRSKSGVTPKKLQTEEEVEEEVRSKKKITTKEKSIKKRILFTKPTIEQIKSYCFERKNKVDPERWIDHYTSNGWMVGKNKMKDWKAAVRTWEKNSAGDNGGNGTPKVRNVREAQIVMRDQMAKKLLQMEKEDVDQYQNSTERIS